MRLNQKVITAARNVGLVVALLLVWALSSGLLFQGCGSAANENNASFNTNASRPSPVGSRNDNLNANTGFNANSRNLNANGRPVNANAKARSGDPNADNTNANVDSTNSNANVSASPMPRTRDALIKEELDRLRNGRILFNPPNTMQQGQPERVEVRISSEDIGAAISKDLKGRGAPQVENVKVGNTMKVFLSSDNNEFSITELSSQEQIVTGRPFAQWEWTVVPQKFGDCALHIRATVPIIIEGVGEKPMDVPVIDRPVHVKVGLRYLVGRVLSSSEIWKYLIGSTSVLGLLGGAWRYFKKRRR